MKIHPAPQGTQEWLDARLGLPTSSQFHRIVTPAKLAPAKGATTYLHELLSEWLTGIPSSDAQSRYMERGNVLEAKARGWYGFETDTEPVEVGLCLTDDPSSLINSSRGDCGFGRFATPADVAMRLNERFPFEGNGERFFTMIYSLFDLETSRLTFCCAGHPGPIRVTRNGETEAMESPALMIGVTPDPRYENTSVELRPGDRLYFYSDGIIEQGDADAELFGRDRLCRTLAAARGRTLQESVDSVVADLSEWAVRDSFDDDLSLVGIEWRGQDDGDSAARAAHG